MDEITQLTLLTLIVAILTLIIAIMTIQKGRLKLLFQIFLSLITCYGILNIIAYFKQEPLRIWSLEEYNPDNLKIFYKEMFWKCVLYSGLSWMFFYIALRLIISKVFHEKLKNFFKSKFSDDKLSDTFIKSYERGRKIKNTLHPTELIQPKQYERSKDAELECDLSKMNSDIALSIHVLISIIILNIPYMAIWIVIACFLLFLMIFGRPIVKGFVDHHYPENPPAPTI